jgi:NAD(P)-dependent dehydrogenase (short-subunit alcohol dehydrogenase family)
MPIGQFEEQRICIVGGTAGIGLAIARFLALEDGEIVIVGRDAERARKVAGGIGLNVEGRAADMLDEASIAAFFNALGPIDHLVVTAAQVRGGAFRDGTIEQARQSMKGKFWSQYLCARHADVRSSILLFSGTLSRRPMPGTAILGAINGAVEALGRSLAVELAPLRVNVISPGLIQGTDAYVAMPEEERDGMIEGAAARLPAGLVGDADSVAGVACAVLASAYVTGAVFDVDGGGLLA